MLLLPSAASRRAPEMNLEEGVGHLSVSQSPSSPHELHHQPPPLFAGSPPLAFASIAYTACSLDGSHGGCFEADKLAGALTDSGSLHCLKAEHSHLSSEDGDAGL